MLSTSSDNQQKTFPGERIDELLELLGVGYSQSDIVEHACDVVPLLCTQLTSASEKSEIQTSASDLLGLLPEICRPKELLITLLEQADSFKDDVLYYALLPPIGRCIRKLPSKRHLSLGLALETFGAHLLAVSLPEESSECTEYLPADLGKNGKSIAALVTAFIDFIEPFVAEVSCSEVPRPVRADSAQFQQISDITRHVIKLLEHPLGGFNLRVAMENSEIPVKNECRLCAERCIALLLQLHPDFVKLISDTRDKNESIEHRRTESVKCHQAGDMELDNENCTDHLVVDEPTSELGLVILSYLVFGEHVCTVGIPQVYEHQFHVEFNLPVISKLLSCTRSTVIHKGIILASEVFLNIGDGMLDATLFQWDQMRSVVEAVLNVMTSSRVKEVCQSAVRLLSTVLRSFVVDGRLMMLEFLLESSDNGSIQGHAVFLLKDEIDQLLRMPGTTCFQFSRLLALVFKVPNAGFRGSLLTRHNDRVMGALNLLRYLLLRDRPSENRTGIRDMLDRIGDGFLPQVRVALQQLRNDVHAEIKNLETNPAVSSHGDSCKLELNVGGESVDGLTPEQQREAMHSSLVSLDMLECVLCRAEELTEKWRTESKQSAVA